MRHLDRASPKRDCEAKEEAQASPRLLLHIPRMIFQLARQAESQKAAPFLHKRRLGPQVAHPLRLFDRQRESPSRGLWLGLLFLWSSRGLEPRLSTHQTCEAAALTSPLCLAAVAASPEPPSGLFSF